MELELITTKTYKIEKYKPELLNDSQKTKKKSIRPHSFVVFRFMDIIQIKTFLTIKILHIQ